MTENNEKIFEEVAKFENQLEMTDDIAIMQLDINTMKYIPKEGVTAEQIELRYKDYQSYKSFHEKNYTYGKNCKFNFYVIALDTKNNYRDYGKTYFNLDLNTAKELYTKKIIENPIHINTMLGVNFLTEKYGLEPYGAGAIDLLQCVDGNIKLSEDYKQTPVLANESLISINTVEILKRDLSKMQFDLDKLKNAKNISEKCTYNKSSLLNKLNENQKKIQNQNNENLLDLQQTM